MKSPTGVSMAAGLFLAAGLSAAGFSGLWIAEIFGAGDAQELRVELREEGARLAGAVNERKLRGSAIRCSGQDSQKQSARVARVHTGEELCGIFWWAKLFGKAIFGASYYQ